MSEFLNDYFQNRFFNLGVEELLDRLPLVAPALPFADPFKRRDKPKFPLPKDFAKVTGPEVEMEITPMQIDSDMDDPDFYSPGYDPTTGKRRDVPTVTPIDTKEGMATYVRQTTEEEKDPNIFTLEGIENLVKTSLTREMAFPTEFNPITGTERITDVSKQLGSGISMGGVPLGTLTTIGRSLNERNLANIAAKAALGKQGYALGMFEGQIIGTRPDYPNIVQGTDVVPQPMQRAITSKMRGFDDRAGVLGKAFDQYTATGGRFDMSRPISPEMKAYEDTVRNLKIPTSLKAELLGFNPNITEPKFDPQRGSFGTVPTPQDYYTITPFEQIQKDIKQTELNRLGDVDSGFTDVSPPSMGLETDISAQESIEESDDTAGFGFDDPFGGFDFKYGGRVNMYPGGFASGKTKTIKGVGLIKPEETFMDTDVVRDRYAFDAENGDYIINGPASNVMRQPISALINYGIDELKKEGVDIRIGNPKIKEKNKVPLLTASSETYVPRIIAEKIGYPILEALNNIGKPEVERLKNKLDDQPTDKSKYEASNGGFLFNDKRRGTMLFNQPVMDVTSPNINRAYDAFVPGISDKPIPMKPDDERFFGDYTLGKIKEALFEKEMKGYEGKGYIFTGVKPKDGKASSAFGTMQITYSTLKDFKDRSKGYKEFPTEIKNYIDALIQQGIDKVNLDLYKGIYRNNKKIPIKKLSASTVQKLKGLKQGVIPQRIHKKYYDKVADAVIRQKLEDYKDEGINAFLRSYGEGQKYADDVENILRDKIQFVDKKELQNLDSFRKELNQLPT